MGPLRVSFQLFPQKTFSPSGLSLIVFTAYSSHQRVALILALFLPMSSTELKTKAVIYKYYMYSVPVSRITCNKELAADGIRRLAVHALPGLRAGCRKSETLCIYGSRFISCTLQGRIHITGNLVHAYNQYQLLRTVCICRNTVCISVNIYQHAIICNGVRAAEKYVCRIGRSLRCRSVRSGISVTVIISAGFNRILKSDFLNRH